MRHDKKMLGLRVAMLASLLLVCLASCGKGPTSTTLREEVAPPQIVTEATSPALYRNVATKVGKISAAKDDLSFTGYPHRADGNQRFMVGTDGQNLLAKPVKDVDAITGDVFSVRTSAGAPNNCGLVSLSQGVLVEPDAALIEPARTQSHEPRFVTVVYATEKTSDKDGSDLLGVYDLFTGEEIIDAHYESIESSGGYVFAYSDDAWDVYEVHQELVDATV